ncbi:hypothetical protein RvY_11084 [Ramazzottius varieornatus]|uniref:Uncharacterized protein n=1 Tax=Ramazzottius varieornatus TaxID=947166 RepID=A0A1D1VEZ5_RAMVA|nr:hypothetical protein RvY_11084 [Ramazzottius varieornatus]
MALDDSPSNPKQQIVLDLYCQRPPWSARIFDVHQAKNIREYIIKTYFRHFEMYKYAFTPTIYMDLKIEYETTAIGVPAEPTKDVKLHDGVRNRELTLEELLHEINLEDEEKSVPGAPAHNGGTTSNSGGQQPSTTNHQPLGGTVDSKIPDSHSATDPSTHAGEAANRQLAELEGLIAKQMDAQLKILRDRITSKFQQLDQLLVTSTNASLPIDQFSLDPAKSANHNAGKHAKKTPPPKKK